MRKGLFRFLAVAAGVLESSVLRAASVRSTLPVDSAMTVTKFVLGTLAVIFGVAALVNYNRGDLYDGNSHWKKYFLGCVTCVVLFGIFSSVAKGG